MAVRRYAQTNIASSVLAAHPIHYVVDTTAELPATGLKLGDTALAIDSNLLYKAASSTTWASVTDAFTKSATFAAAAGVAATTMNIWLAPFNCTVTALKGYRLGGTGATINAYRATSGTALRSANLSLASSDLWTDGGTLQNTAFSTNQALLVGVTSVTGTPTQVSIQVNFTRP